MWRHRHRELKALMLVIVYPIYVLFKKDSSNSKTMLNMLSISFQLKSAHYGSHSLIVSAHRYAKPWPPPPASRSSMMATFAPSSATISTLGQDTGGLPSPSLSVFSIMSPLARPSFALSHTPIIVATIASTRLPAPSLSTPITDPDTDFLSFVFNFSTAAFDTPLVPPPIESKKI